MPSFKNRFDFLKLSPKENPCLGLVFSRDSIEALQTTGGCADFKISWSEKVSLKEPLFLGNPSAETIPGLISVLKPLLRKNNDQYTHLQVALPDPLIRLEVLELEKAPPSGKPLNEFLKWRLNPHQEEMEPLNFSTQLLGESEGKKLLLVEAVNQKWLETLHVALKKSGMYASVTDAAFRFRFNFFHEKLTKLGGALITVEPEYWSLGIWDEKGRHRSFRSKWWKKEISQSKDIPLTEIIKEVERTIRSYVYSGGNRNVENLWVLAPSEWQKLLVDRFRRHTAGNCEGLTFGAFGFRRSARKEGPGSPSVIPVGVRS